MTEHDPWRAGLAGWLPADLILRWRAAAVLEKSGIAGLLGGCRTIVDLGCGTGHVGEAVLGATDGFRLIMIDPVWGPSRRLRRRLDRSAPGRWDYIAARAQDLPLDAASADLVLLAFVLHHADWSEQRQILGEAGRILKPGGRLVLIEDTPQGRDATRRTVMADRILNAEMRSAPHNYRTAGKWATELAAAGFRVEAQTHFQDLPPRVTCRPVPHSCLVSRKNLLPRGKTVQARP